MPDTGPGRFLMEISAMFGTKIDKSGGTLDTDSSNALPYIEDRGPSWWKVLIPKKSRLLPYWTTEYDVPCRKLGFTNCNYTARNLQLMDSTDWYSAHFYGNLGKGELPDQPAVDESGRHIDGQKTYGVALVLNLAMHDMLAATHTADAYGWFAVAM
nr:hypothetical protein CFP56_22557 [Quercus suber]